MVAGAGAAGGSGTPAPTAANGGLTIVPPDDSFFDEIGIYCFEHADHIPCAVGCGVCCFERRKRD